MSDIEYTSLTPDDVERKNYTYVAVMVVDRQGKETHDAFLVPSPYKAEAAKLAKLYCIRHSLTLARWRAGGGGAHVATASRYTRAIIFAKRDGYMTMENIYSNKFRLQVSPLSLYVFPHLTRQG